MTPEAIEATNAHWKFQRLSALKDELSSERRAQFALLEERFGEAKSYSNRRPAGPNLSLVFAAMDQLGLKLQPAKGPVEVLVVVHAERPTPN